MANYSAAADRNKDPILEVLRPSLQPGMSVLEIASGTAQHVVHFARELPDVEFLPTEKDEEGLAEIVVALMENPLRNVRPPLVLDVLGRWPAIQAVDAVVCINLIHIAPWEATSAMFAGAARVLKRHGGRVLLYGPYREGGAHTAPSNEAFDQWLKDRDPRFGVRDLDEVRSAAAAHGFAQDLLVRMPSNNLCVGFVIR